MQIRPLPTQPNAVMHSTPQRIVEFGAKKPPVYTTPPPHDPGFDVEEEIRNMPLDKKKRRFAFHKVIHFDRHPVDLTIFLLSISTLLFPPIIPVGFVLLMGRTVYRTIEAKCFTPEENLDAFLRHYLTGRRPNPFDY